jgi:hypothetical protein
MTFKLQTDPDLNNSDDQWIDSVWWGNFVDQLGEEDLLNHTAFLDMSNEEWVVLANKYLKPYDAVYHEDYDTMIWSLTFVDDQSFMAFVLEWS